MLQKAQTIHDSIPPSIIARQFSCAKAEKTVPGHALPPIAVLKSQMSPFIAVEDFLGLWQARAVRSAWQNGRRLSAVLAIDVRPPAEYATGHLPYACYNIPADDGGSNTFSFSAPSPFFNRVNIFFSSGSHRTATALLPEYGLHASYQQQLTPWKGKLLVILANRGKSGPNFAERLVQLHFPNVCILSGGLSALRVQGVLTEVTTT